MIQGVHEVIAQHLNNKEAQSQLKIAQIAVKRMMLYVRGLAYLEHIEGNTLQVGQSLFEVPRTVQEILDYFSLSLEMKKLGVSIQAQSFIPQIASDKDKYEMILYNILENSVKYTFKGRIDISLSFCEEDNLLVTQIKDTGTGIDPEHRRNLFKLFANKPKECDLNPQGIGLGLYMAGSLIKELGGTVQLNSTQGVGTTVTFTIKQATLVPEPTDPMTESDVLLDYMNEHHEFRPVPRLNAFMSKYQCWTGSTNEEEKRPPSAGDTDRVPLISPKPTPSSSTFKLPHFNCTCNKVLVVDDESMNLFIFKNYLTGLGLEGDYAQNGQEAIEAIMKRREECDICRGYRVIFMDINMPVMNGIDATRKIVELITTGKIPSLYVIAVTAAAHLEDKAIFAGYTQIGFTTICKLMRGFIRIVEKPVPKAVFSRILEPLLL